MLFFICELSVGTNYLRYSTYIHFYFLYFGYNFSEKFQHQGNKALWWKALLNDSCDRGVLGRKLLCQWTLGAAYGTQVTFDILLLFYISSPNSKGDKERKKGPGKKRTPADSGSLRGTSPATSTWVLEGLAASQPAATAFIGDTRCGQPSPVMGAMVQASYFCHYSATTAWQRPDDTWSHECGCV